MNLYNRILGHPFVYDKIRPLVVGGIDVSTVYRALEVVEDDVVMDVGCGLGEALRYLPPIKKFVGIDIDEEAIKVACERYSANGNVLFKAGYLTAADVEEHLPSCAVMSGVLHHCDDRTVVEILSLLKKSPRLRRLVTSDIVYLPGEIISNTLAWLDRGRFCRKPKEYQEIVKQAGFEVLSSEIINCSSDGKGLAKYFVMKLAPRQLN